MLFLKNIYLTVLDLKIWHMGSSSQTRDKTQASYLESGVLATGPLGKSA